jgi:hypothetical protein
MHEHFVTYNQALTLKELGFDEPCFGFYYMKEIDLFQSCKIQDRRNSSYVKNYMDEEDCTVPLKQQVFKWFRDKYNLKSCIMFRTSMEDDKEYYDWLIKEQEVVYRHFKTYEEAESACIDKLIKIVKAK